MSARITAFVYGVLCCSSFLTAFLYSIGFFGNFIVPQSIDSGHEVSFSLALTVNGILLGLFAAQHSVMAHRTES
jgi:methanethiol S-methyltransferase